MDDRKIRIESLIKEASAKFVRLEANSDPLITMTRVDISSDFKSALIFFTTIPDGKEGDALIFLKRSSGDFRSYLKKNARFKFIPHIEFMIDAGERHRQNLDEMVRDLDEGKK